MRRAHLGRMFDEKRRRSPEAAARSRAFGFCTSTGPIPVWIARTGSCPWRTTRWRPSGSTSSAVEARNVSNSASTAWAIRRRAPVRSISVSGSSIAPFLSKGNNSILSHGVTLLLGGSGGLITNPVTPPSSHRHPVSSIARIGSPSAASFRRCQAASSSAPSSMPIACSTDRKIVRRGTRLMSPGFSRRGKAPDWLQ